mmetsp:Transcript_20290/g.48790  ORF Transcript_20290/g.48790 Transcript_20290/m.48790 type:complete len:244 (+) Transcript_20290:543-1274(+)
MLRIQKGITIVQSGAGGCHAGGPLRKRPHLRAGVVCHGRIASVPQQHGHQPGRHGTIHGIGPAGHEAPHGLQHGLEIVLPAVTSNHEVERLVHVDAQRRSPSPGIGRVLRRIQRHAQEPQLPLRLRPLSPLRLVREGGIRQHRPGLVPHLQYHAPPHGADAVPTGEGAILLVGDPAPLLVAVPSTHTRGGHGGGVPRHYRGVAAYQEEVVELAHRIPLPNEGRRARVQVEYDLGDDRCRDALA